MRGAAHPHEKPHHPHWPLASLLFAFVLALGFNSVHEPAGWVRVKVGSRILAERALPRRDIFSYGAAGAPWTTNSWLSDAVFAELHRTGGPALLETVKAGAIAAGFALLLPIS